MTQPKKYNPDLSENLIVKITFQFSLDIVRFTELLESKRKFVVANQLIKSGTSIGANVREPQNAESKPDFIHKMKIAAKEADETEYWLLIANHADNYPACDELLANILAIKKILSKIIASSKRKQSNQESSN
ncbi:MAG: four helix bundle protein [Cyclobacteriaceae bacterium]|nr:four helix bundle protein [Cyclobacteriaceae bacterium]